jgi:hypothetical protein
VSKPRRPSTSSRKPAWSRIGQLSTAPPEQGATTPLRIKTVRPQTRQSPPAARHPGDKARECMEPKDSTMGRIVSRQRRGAVRRRARRRAAGRRLRRGARRP